MVIRTLVLAGATSLAVQGSASAASMSMNWIDLGTIPNVDACIAAGENTFLRNGLTILSRSTNAAWGENLRQDELYTIYCIMDRGIAVITGAGDDLDAVDGMVTRLIDSFGQTGPTGKPTR